MATAHGSSHVPWSDERAAQATQFTSQEAHFFSPEAQRSMKKHGCEVLASCLPREASGSGERESKTSVATPTPPYALVVLGSHVGPWLEPLWTGATIRVCADGGANHLYDKLSPEAKQRFLPHAIIGNMQKIHEETLNYYQGKHGVNIVKDMDPSTTDATKGCFYVRDMLSTAEAFSRIDSVICYGAFGGRLDHELGNLDTLRRVTSGMPVARVLLLSEGNLAEYLTPGYHLIECCSTLEGIGTRCGIFPLGNPVQQCHTMGLKYNLDGEGLEFGKLISVSNQICARQVRIRVSDGVIWSTECEPVYPTGHQHGERAKSQRLRQQAERSSGTEEDPTPTPQTSSACLLAAAGSGGIRDPTQQVAQAYHA